MIAAHEGVRAEERLFWVNALDALLARWHGDKEGSRAGTRALDGIRQALAQAMNPRCTASETKKKRPGRKQQR